MIVSFWYQSLELAFTFNSKVISSARENLSHLFFVHLSEGYASTGNHTTEGIVLLVWLGRIGLEIVLTASV